MTTTVTALFDTYGAASAAVRDLKTAGVPEADISLVACSSCQDYQDEVAKDAGTGAAVGAGVGGAGALLAGLGLIAIPGLGPVVAAGWLATTAVTAAGAAAGAAVGAATGGLIGALTADGIHPDEAHVYAESIKRGGTLVVARVPNLRLDAARDMLAAHETVDPRDRRAAYEQDGWTGFDSSAPLHEPRTPRDPAHPDRRL